MTSRGFRGRLNKDIADLVNNTTGIILVDYDEARLSYVECAFSGEEGSPWAGGTFEVHVRIPTNFPFKPPKVTFNTRVWHPNISDVGTVCVDVLDNAWAPGIHIIEVVEACKGLLTQPNPLSPLNTDAAMMFLQDISMYCDCVKTWTQVHAGGTSAPEFYMHMIQSVERMGYSTVGALWKLSRHNWNLQDIRGFSG